jgi:hypothetical protein
MLPPINKSSRARPVPTAVHPPRKLPGVLAERLAKLARVPAEYRDEFCGRISEIVQNAWKRDRRSTGQKPGPRLVYAADAARTLQKEFFRIKKDDRDWVETIKQFQMQFLAGEIDNVEATITNLSMLLNAAVGRPSPLPPHLAKGSLKIKDQMLRELVFGLLAAADNTGRKLTFNKNSETGTLAKALDLLRNYLPTGLVPEPLPAAVIQRLKADFFRMQR